MPSSARTHVRPGIAHRPRPGRGIRHRAAIAGVLALAGFWAWAVATPTSVFATCSSGSATFGSTGAEECYSVGAGVSEVAITAIGGNGGNGYEPPFSGTGGAGAVVSGDLPVIPGEVLYVEVGASGVDEGSADFGGGGAGAYESGSGGGASDVRTCSETAGSCAGGATTLATRVLVAGGGGGGGSGGDNSGGVLDGAPGGEAATGSLVNGSAGATGANADANATGGGGGGGGTLAAGGSAGTAGSGNLYNGGAGGAGGLGTGGAGNSLSYAGGR
jgi:hypothetical protein